MEEFFVIGSEDPSFINADRITRLPQCLGVVLAGGKNLYNRYVPPSYFENRVVPRVVSLGSFLNYVKKNPGVTLVSCFDFAGGRLFVQKLYEASKGKFEYCDYYNFCLKHNIEIMFAPAQTERETILAAKKEWAEFRKQLTDEFSQVSLDCYLEAYEKKDTSRILPAYVGFENIFFNRQSRKLSVVPGREEKYVDVGALDGDTVTAFLDSAAGYKSIYAFEPVPAAFAGLKKKEFYLDRFYPRPEAVSNFSGKLNFYTAGSRVADASTPSEESHPISCVKLDDVVDEVTLLKIEVEGHEPAVIEGAANLIKKCRPEMVVHAYHFPLDPVRILEAVKKAHSYRHVALRFYTVGMHIFSMLFSDRASFE